MTKNERANKIFEERNRGFRILYDTILDITTKDTDKDVYTVITENMKKICKGEFSGVISIDITKKEGYIKSLIDSENNVYYCDENCLDNGADIPKCIVDNLSKIKVGDSIPEYKALLFLFPHGKKYMGTELDNFNIHYFKLASYGDGEDVGFVGLPMDKKLKLKDIVETFVNMTSLILQRAKGKQELIDMNNKFSTLLESSPVGIMLVDDNRKVVEVNSSLLDLIGLDRSDCIKRPCFETFCNNESKLCENICENCVSLENENTIINRDGKEVPVLHCVNRITINDRKYFLETIVDISEVKKMEAEKKILMKRLFQMQKLDSLMTLASGVAHEINTPIQALTNDIGFVNKAYGKAENIIQSYKEIVDRHVTDRDTMDKIEEEFRLLEDKQRFLRTGKMFSRAVLEMQGNLKHISDIVNYVKDFSRLDDIEMREEDINQMVRNFVNIYSHELKGKIILNTNTQTDIPFVKCIPSLIKEAIFELLNNAVDALENIEEDQRSPVINIETYSKEGYVGISISDNGTGIEKNIQDRIFDPFYTTKDVGMGTGQGLTNVFSVIVDKHNGQVYFDSDIGVGSKFFIEIPI